MNHIPISVGVVICTHTEDRWEIFVKAVESVQAQTLPPDQIAASHTDLIAFLPRVLGTGGRTEPLWMVTRPGWFPDEFFWTVGCSWRGLPEQRAEVRNPTGGNMVVRRKAFDEAGKFRIGIGRVGTIPLGCEETELCIRMRRRWPEKIFLFEPAAVIHHQVTAPRATWHYFLRRCYAEGLSKALVSRFVGAKDGLSAERRHVLRVLPVGVLRGIGDTLFHFDLWGLGRAVTIILGTIIAAAGYIAGRRSTQIRKISEQFQSAASI